MDFYRGLPFCHQSSFIKTSIQKSNKFPSEYKIYADYAMFADLANRGVSFSISSEVIAIFDCTGISSRKRLANFRELYLIRNKYYNKNNLFTIFFILDLIFREIVKFILPVNIVRRIRLMRNRTTISDNVETL